MSRLAHALFPTVLCIGISVFATNAVSGSIQSGYRPNNGAASVKTARGPALGKAIAPPASAKQYAGKVPPASGAGGPVTFVSGKLVLGYLPQNLPATGLGKQAGPGPGTSSANLPPVSGQDSERARASRVFPANLNRGAYSATKTVVPTYGATTANGSPTTTTPMAAVRVGGDASPQGPASVAELARALSYDPDLIYQYVRNNIEFYPIFGVQKGSLGAVLDNQGTAYDQAMLMVDLLRASGYTATFVTGVIKVTAAQMNQWYDILLQRVQPETDAFRLRISGQADNSQAFIGFVQRLQGDAFWRNVEPLSEVKQPEATASGGKPLAFQLAVQRRRP